MVIRIDVWHVMSALLLCIIPDSTERNPVTAVSFAIGTRKILLFLAWMKVNQVFILLHLALCCFQGAAGGLPPPVAPPLPLDPPVLGPEP